MACTHGGPTTPRSSARGDRIRAASSWFHRGRLGTIDGGTHRSVTAAGVEQLLPACRREEGGGAPAQVGLRLGWAGLGRKMEGRVCGPAGMRAGQLDGQRAR